MDTSSIAGFLPLILLLVSLFSVDQATAAQQKRRKEMLSKLQKGDRVVTIGGIFGMIKSSKKIRWCCVLRIM